MINQYISEIKNMLFELYQKEEHFLHEPFLKNKVKQYLNQTIDQNWISAVGPMGISFEKEIQAYTRMKHAILTVNGTSALHLLLHLNQIHDQHEVLVPSLTFIATINAISYTGAIAHFIDISEETLAICPIKLEKYLDEIAVIKNGIVFNQKTGREIKAIIPMHMLGHPIDLTTFDSLLKKYPLLVIEDAAEAFGSLIKNQHVGSYGQASIFSFNGNKIISTGAGGVILTNDSHIAQKARHLSTTAKVKHPYLFIHDEIGFNYRMSDLNAAVGLAQLEYIDELLANKREIAHQYQTITSSFNGISFFKEPNETRSNYWLNTIILDDTLAQNQDQIIQAFHEAKIFVRPIWQPIHLLEIYQDSPKANLDATEYMYRKIINLPSSPNIFKKEND